MESLEQLRRDLLDLHKALVDSERRFYEKQLGRLPDGEFLEALVKDPAFAWLSPLTGLIVALDEALEEKTATGDYRGRIRELLSPKEISTEFHRRYAELLQRTPEVVVAHGAVMRAL